VLAALQGDYFRIDSKVLGRPLHIYVSLPEAYGSESKTYPTVYLTDGDSLFPILAPTHLFLGYDEPVPAAIMVGIAYGTFDPNAGNMRDVDYRAPPTDKPGTGAAAFQRFLADELCPEVERRYRSNPQRRILVGQSRGGSFVLYSAFTAPDMFWGRIASNSSFNPRATYYTQPATATLPGLGLYVSSGERDRADLRTQALEWFAYWRDRTDLPWTLKTATMENGTHAVAIPEVYRRGMIWLFRDEPPAR
jgi:predicted alpha/beta superfamily hydrolase